MFFDMNSGNISARLLHLVARFYFRKQTAWPEGLGCSIFEDWGVGWGGGQELKLLAGEVVCSRH